MRASTARRGAFALIVFLVGCSSTVQQITVSAPWDPELAPFFDDAADFVANPGDLDGTWATDYAVELRGRVDAADLIARVHVTTIREDISVDGARRKHLVMRVTSVLHGVDTPDSRLYLSVDEGSAGFDTIDRNERRLLDNRFVAYVRWYEDDDETIRSHWHLSPASSHVIGTTRSALAERGQATPGPDDADDDE